MPHAETNQQNTRNPGKQGIRLRQLCFHAHMCAHHSTCTPLNELPRNHGTTHLIWLCKWLYDERLVFPYRACSLEMNFLSHNHGVVHLMVRAPTPNPNQRPKSQALLAARRLIATQQSSNTLLFWDKCALRQGYHKGSGPKGAQRRCIRTDQSVQERRCGA